RPRELFEPEQRLVEILGCKTFDPADQAVANDTDAVPDLLYCSAVFARAGGDHGGETDVLAESGEGLHVHPQVGHQLADRDHRVGEFASAHLAEVRGTMVDLNEVFG